MEFVARVASPTGVIGEQTFTADSEQDLRRDLEGRGMLVYKVRPKGLRLAGSTIGARGRIDEQDFLTFNQELVALIHAGLPLLQCLTLLSERRKNPTFRQALIDIQGKVKSGSSLSDAFASHGATFPPVYAPTVMAGEKSGNLEEVLRRYVAYAQVMEGIKRKVRAAMVYPIILICLSVTLVAILVAFVIPKFASFYKDFDAELPLITRILIAVSSFASDHFWLLLGGVVLLVLGARMAEGYPPARSLRDRLLLRLPVGGEVLRKYNVSQFARTLSTLLGGGLPLVPSLEIACGAVGNSWVADRLRAIVGRIREGAALSDTLDATGLWSDTTLQMVRVGESAGALTEMLVNVSNFYDAEVDRQVQRFVTLLEPALLVIMGTLIAGMLLAMYYPLFTLIQVVK